MSHVENVHAVYVYKTTRDGLSRYNLAHRAVM